MANKKQKWPYCDPGYSSTNLSPGRSITVGRAWSFRGDKADFKQFLNTPVKELEKRLKASEAEEKKVFDEMKKAIEAWDEHGAQSLLLQKAIEYLKTPEVKHTNNEWVKRKDGTWEISNLTYKMTFSVKKDGDQWKLDWELSYTAPALAVGHWSYSRYPRERIDHESGKKYKTMDGAQKYVQAKFDEFAAHFSSLCPPVPEDAKSLFSVNGQLLPAYKLEKRKVVEPMEKTVSKLLDCLDEEDMQPPKPAEEKPKDTEQPPKADKPKEAEQPPKADKPKTTEQPSPAGKAKKNATPVKGQSAEKFAPAISASGKVITRRTPTQKPPAKAKPSTAKKKAAHKKKPSPAR